MLVAGRRRNGDGDRRHRVVGRPGAGPGRAADPLAPAAVRWVPVDAVSCPCGPAVAGWTVQVRVVRRAGRVGRGDGEDFADGARVDEGAAGHGAGAGQVGSAGVGAGVCGAHLFVLLERGSLGRDHRLGLGEGLVDPDRQDGACAEVAVDVQGADLDVGDPLGADDGARSGAADGPLPGADAAVDAVDAVLEAAHARGVGRRGLDGDVAAVPPGRVGARRRRDGDGRRGAVGEVVPGPERLGPELLLAGVGGVEVVLGADVPVDEAPQGGVAGQAAVDPVRGEVEDRVVVEAAPQHGVALLLEHGVEGLECAPHRSRRASVACVGVGWARRCGVGRVDEQALARDDRPEQAVPELPGPEGAGVLAAAGRSRTGRGAPGRPDAELLPWCAAPRRYQSVDVRHG